MYCLLVVAIHSHPFTRASWGPADFVRRLPQKPHCFLLPGTSCATLYHSQALELHHLFTSNRGSPLPPSDPPSLQELELLPSQKGLVSPVVASCNA